MAAKLAAGLACYGGTCVIRWKQMKSIQLPEAVIEGLVADGFQFYRWEGEHSTTLRLVTAFNTREEDVTLVEAARRYSCGFHTALGELTKV